MSQKNFQACLVEVLRHEGGFSIHPKDPGNWTGGKVGVGQLKGTNKGIASHSHPHLDIKNLTDDQIAAIYRKGYWDTVKADTLLPGVDLATFDASVMSGPGRARKWLMASLGGDGPDTIKRLCAKRLGFVQALKTWNTFGRGWLRRITDVEAKSVAMFLTAINDRTVTPALREEKAKADVTAKQQAGGAAATGTVGTAGAATTDVTSADTMVIIAAAVILLGLAAFLAWRFIVNRARATSYGETIDAVA